MQLIAEVEFTRDLRQRAFIDHARAPAGKLAFVGARKPCVQQFGGKQADQGIAEELQAFIVARAGAAMAKRLFAQGQVAEGVAESSAQAQYVAPLDRSMV